MNQFFTTIMIDSAWKLCQIITYKTGKSVCRVLNPQTMIPEDIIILRKGS